MDKLPPHLGGHLNKTHTDEGILKYFRDKYNCKSMVDIGCGPGGQSRLAYDLGYDPVLGVDGDFTLKRSDKEGIGWILHDYTTGPLSLDGQYDLAWSCEFVEHVEPKYVDNFMQTFNCARYVAMTFHPPSPKNNPWHFNEQPTNYWLELFGEYGWTYRPQMTEECRENSTMHRNFFRDNGLVFSK